MSYPSPSHKRLPPMGQPDDGSRGKYALVALLTLGLSLAACGGGLIRGGSGQQDSQIEVLRRQNVELQRRATVGEVETRRLQQEVDRLRGELTARDAAAEVAVRAAAQTAALGRVAEEPVEPGSLIDSAPIEAAELDLEPVVLAETLEVAGTAAATKPVAAPVEEIQRPDRPAARRAEAEPRPQTLEQVDPAQTLYDQAYTLFHQKRYGEAEAAFRQFIERHATSNLADNAQFWIGESRYARGDFASALAAFTATVQTYPAGNKVPDAMLKAGKCFEALGDMNRAKESYREVRDGFPGTAAAAQAQDRLNAIR